MSRRDRDFGCGIYPERLSVAYDFGEQRRGVEREQHPRLLVCNRFTCRTEYLQGTAVWCLQREERGAHERQGHPPVADRIVCLLLRGDVLQKSCKCF